MMDDGEGIKAEIRERATEAGFDAVGFAPARAVADAPRHLAAYLRQGRHGDMAWMETTRERRADPGVLWAEARSVVALGMSYAPEEDPRAVLARPDRAAISVYAKGKDYHDLVKSRLKQVARWMHEKLGAEVKVFVDTAPVMEKPLAQAAGLGWQGKHTALVSRRHGAWLFLGEVFTTLDLPPDPPAADVCGSCRRCLDACPTEALDVPYRIDARACISYLTIEHDGPIPERHRAAMGNRVFGCDDCLAACPWNKFATPHKVAAFAARPATDAPLLAWLASLDDARFREAFAGTPIKRTGRDRMVRNALIAVGNGGDPAHRALARSLLDDPSPQVRDAARWALDRFEGPA